eukprot:1086304_1
MIDHCLVRFKRDLWHVSVTYDPFDVAMVDWLLSPCVHQRKPHAIAPNPNYSSDSDETMMNTFTFRIDPIDSLKDEYTLQKSIHFSHIRKLNETNLGATRLRLVTVKKRKAYRVCIRHLTPLNISVPTCATVIYSAVYDAYYYCRLTMQTGSPFKEIILVGNHSALNDFKVPMDIPNGTKSTVFDIR